MRRNSLSFATLAVIAVFVSTTPVRAQATDSDSAKMWRPGWLHQNELAGSSGEVWMALCRTEKGFELVETAVAVVDTPGGMLETDRYVRVNRQSETLWLFRGIPALKEGPVLALFSGRNQMDEGQELVLSARTDLTDFYNLYAMGERDGGTVRDYHLQLVHASTDRMTELIEERKAMDPESCPTLLWAGDLDRDGRLDRVVDMAHGYNSTVLTLYLSSAAGFHQLVKKVASISLIGC